MSRYVYPVQELASLADKYGVPLVFLNVLLEQLGVPVVRDFRLQMHFRVPY